MSRFADNQNDVLDCFAYPKTHYGEQIELLVADLIAEQGYQILKGVISHKAIDDGA